MATSLLALLDDIAAIMDDVAIISKVAAKKTAGVLGDDLALNAEQVSGVKANRELPVVWAVAKGSFINKLILVPSALLISAVYPPLIIILLVLGGLYLCFEGFEKIAHKLFHTSEQNAVDKQRRQALHETLNKSKIELLALEKEKIRGAIRTDFVLSAEIIVIILGAATDEPFINQVITLSLLSVAFTVGVYGLVALIVKLDDIGVYFLAKNENSLIGKGLLSFAPMLMKTLSVVGTAAMFLVGGGILVHDVAFIHHFIEVLNQHTDPLPSLLSTSLNVFYSLLVGVAAGGLVMLVVSLFKKLKGGSNF